ncbi:MAG TPA: hypothetical protein PK216_03850 [Aquimonas sp.]|nr:hypothetical protein [Aquimonas sp.]
MRPSPFLAASASLVIGFTAHAGTLSASYYSLLDHSFNPGLPGRATIAFDQSGTAFTDIGINAFSDPDLGNITSVAQVDINNADPNLVGIGLARTQFNGLPDTSFQTNGKRVKDAFLTSVVDACVDPNGRIVVAGMTPGANGSGGAKDLALVRFNANGSDDLSFGGDGGVAFSLASESGGDEFDEGIRDVECLSNGNVLVAAWYDQGSGKNAVVAEMPSTGLADPVRFQTYGTSAGIDAVATFAAEVDGGIVVGLHYYGASNSAFVRPLVPSGATYATVPGRDQQAFGTGWSTCGGIAQPQFLGMASLETGDYVISGLRNDGVNNVPILVRIQYGEQTLVSCLDINNGVNNAYVTPPTVLGDLVFVAAGLQPFASGALTSRIKGFVAPADGTVPVPAPGYGSNGMVEWSYPYSTSNASNNRSFVQRLYFDPAYGLMAVGTRTWNGNDTDVALARFGSTGDIFRNGFEAD